MRSVFFQRFFLVSSLLGYGGCLFSTAESEWQIETIDAQSDVGWYASLALDSADHAHISYYDFTQRCLKYAWWDGSYWQIQTIDAGQAGTFTSLALDAQGYPHISYAGPGLKYAYWTGGSWQITPIDLARVTNNTSLALGKDSSQHVAYQAKGYLRYAHYQDQEWQIEKITRNREPMECALALDESNHPHIAYVVNKRDDVLHVFWNGQEWVENNPPGTSAIDGFWPSIKIGPSGSIHISFWESNHGRRSQGNLNYFSYSQGQWKLETIDAQGDTGWYSSLALDVKGIPHVSYHNHTYGTLKYAYATAAGWQNQVVDAAGGMVGYCSSLALDSQGQPQIAYYDVAKKDLKFARWIPDQNQAVGKMIKTDEYRARAKK